MGARGEELRAAVVALGRSRRNEAIPRALRAELMRHARAARSRGAGWGAIARELGVSATGLQRWFEPKRPRRRVVARLRPVQLKAEAAAAPERRALCLITPQGYRVEGLDAAALVALLRALV